MKKTWSARLLCLIMLIAMALPPATASAERVSSNGQFIQMYNSPDVNDKANLKVVVDPQEASQVESGWYYVSALGKHYARASDLVFLDPTPTPTPSATAVPSLSPGVTASPTPEIISGETDLTYEGSILSYTVPAGGLWLYDKVGGKAVESIGAGVSIKLTSVSSSDGWYSIYYKSTTYYVPESILYVNPSATSEIKNTASVVLKAGTIYLYSAATAGTTASPPDLNKNITNNTLEGGTRVNAKYYNTFWYSYSLGGKTYYIYAGDVVDGLNSTASVGSNEDTTLMREFTVAAGTTLYRVKDLTSTNSYVLPSAEVLYGVRVDDDWNRVMYKSETFYLPNDPTMGSTQVAVASATSGTTYWATVGSNGAYLYKTRSRNTSSPETGSVGKLPAGLSILATPVDSSWYSYSSGGVLYYIYAADLGASISTSAVTSTRVFIKSGTPLYDSMAATNSAFSLSSSAVTLDGVDGDYYVVQSTNDTWYSINYDSKLYYIKKADVNISSSTTKYITVSNATLYENLSSGNPSQAVTGVSGSLILNELISGQSGYCDPPPGETWYARVTYNGTEYLLANTSGSIGVITETDYSTPIATTTAGKQYYVTIGLTGATLYKDAACTQPATQTINAGEVIKATKYTDSLYIVESGGAKYYLPIRFIAMIKSGDDASAVSPSASSDPISDIVKGESNTDYSGTVLSYKVPTGGLWLYYKMENSARSMSLNYGATVQLTEVSSNTSWYTTWYGGTQYYVPKSSLSVTDTDTVVNGTYSITLSSNVTLYTTAGFSSTGVPTSSNKSTTITLNSGAQVNVRVYSKVQNGVTIYAYTHYDGKTYYFPSSTSGTANVEPNSAISATIDSNTSASFITQFIFDASSGVVSVTLYTSPNKDSSSSTDVSFATKPLVLYGVKYDSYWYKVIYDNATWYLWANDAQNPEQITISSSASSTTYTVVIGTSEVKLYTKPDATNNTYYSGLVLQPGETILASRVNTTWYSCAKNGGTYYFMASQAANNNSTAAVSSYVIQIDASDNVALYNTVSSTGKSILTLPTNTYTMRKINSEWSSVFYKGTTYYVKNADLPTDAVNASTPIASTTIGKTYRITIGQSGADVFSSGKLTPPKQGTLSGGYQTTGTKLYFADSSAPNGLVYSISYGGKVSYISAAAVTGVYEGDEVEEAKQAAEQAAASAAAASTVAIGSSTLHTFNIGTQVYSSQSTSSTTFTIPSTMILNATKVNANWYSISYAGITYYVPATQIEGSSTTTQVTVSVGESYTLTFIESIWCYAEPETWATVAETILAGETYVIKRISDTWYEVNYKGTTYYLLATQVKLPVITNTTTTTTTTTTTDGTGYITDYLTVSVVSGSLNLRKTASTSGVILDRIPNGAQIKNNSYTVDSAKKVWYNVTYNGKTGYVLGDYVKPVGTASSQTGTSTDPSTDIGKTFLVNTASVNIRSGPGMKYSIIGRLDKNVSVTPIDYAVGDDNMTWYKFQYSTSVTAWIRSDYLAGSAISSMEQSGNVAIKQGDTNIRSGPGDSFSVVVKLPRDTIVSIVGKGTDSNEVLWYRIMYNNVSGYVRSDLVRPLTAAETSTLMASVISQYTELKYGSKGTEVKTLQEQLIRLGFLAAGTADGIYGNKTTEAVKAYQRSKNMTQTGVATAALQAQLFNTATSTSTSSIQSLDWFTTGYNLINANKNITIYDISSGITWNAKYINGANHADIIPASKADATKLVANNIVGSYVRRSVIVTIAGTRYAGSMYALGHGSTNYCDYFSGVMCIHFTGSKTHGTNNVDADHQAAISEALTSGL